MASSRRPSSKGRKTKLGEGAGLRPALCLCAERNLSQTCLPSGLTAAFFAPPRQVYEEVLRARKEAAAAASAEAAGGGGGGSGGLPAGLKVQDPSVLQAPGRDGAPVVVMEGGVAVAYSWDGAK